jgi:hypothetical protein
MEDVNPLERAQADEQASARERSEGMHLYGTAADLAKTAENLRQAGYADAAAPLDAAADHFVNAGSVDVAQSKLYGAAADMWHTANAELDQQSRTEFLAAGPFLAGDFARKQAAEATDETERAHHLEDANRMVEAEARMKAEARAYGEAAKVEGSVAESLEAEARRLGE